MPTDNELPSSEAQSMTPTTATQLKLLELEQFRSLNTAETCAKMYCHWVRNSLKLGHDQTDLEILQTMAPHFFIWSAAWKAKV